MNTILFSRSVGSSERFEKWDCSRTVASSKSAGGTRLPRGQEDCSAEGARIEALERRWALGFSGGTAPLGYGPDVAHIIVMFRFTQIRLNKVYTDWMTSFI